MAISFFKTPKNKQYSYKPVFYDAKKEEREKRHKSAVESNPDDLETGLRERMHTRWRRGTGTRERKASNQRLIIIIVVIVLLGYLFFM